jgi:hypothetical protein
MSARRLFASPCIERGQYPDLDPDNLKPMIHGYAALLEASISNKLALAVSPARAPSRNKD